MKSVCTLQSVIKTMLLCLTFAYTATAQISYRVGIDSDKKTYRVYMKSATEYKSNRARIATAQVTLVVPTGTGANKFEPTNVQGKTVGTNQMIWNLNSRVDAPPVENPSKDYLSFGFNGSGSAIIFDMLANEEIELFSFRNSGNCTGAIALFDNNTDPFRRPNSQNTNPGNQMTVLGAGFDNAYIANYGGEAECGNTSAVADLTASISGPSSMSVGASASAYTIDVHNMGLGASTGQITVNTILPVGIVYNSFSGAGWACLPVAQANGNTNVSCSTSASINIMTSNLLTLNVTANASAAASVSMTGSVSGGGEVNIANNSFSNTIAINNQGNNISNVNVQITGPANITANNPINLSFTANNSGSAIYTGSTVMSIVLPAGAAYNSFSGTGWTCTTGANLLCTNTNPIPAGGSQSPLIINMNVPASSPNNTLVISGNLVSSGGGSVNPFSNSFPLTTVIVNKPNIQGVIVGPSAMTVNAPANYQVNVTNAGTGATSGNITATIALPSGMTFNGATGSGWACTPSTVGGTTSLTCGYGGVINANASAPELILNLTPTAVLGGTNIILSGVLATPNEAGTNNKGFSQNVNIIAIGTPVGLSSSITGPTNLSPSATSNIVINVSNTGTNPTTGKVEVNLVLPNGIDLDGVAGTGWNCNVSPLSNGTVGLLCSNTTVIAPNSTATPLTLTVRPTAGTVGTNITISGSVNAPNITNGSGNNFTITLPVQAVITLKPDLQASISGPTSLTAGIAGNYLVNLSNVGNGPTTGAINTSISIPAGVTYMSNLGTNWTCNPTALANGTTTVACNYTGAIAANTFANPLTLLLMPSAGIAGTTVNVSGTVSTPNESNTTNNNYNQNINIVAVASPSINLSVSIAGPTALTASTSGNYIINIANTGANSSSGTVVANITLPVGMVYNSGTGTNWACTATPLANGSTGLACSYTSPIQGNTFASSLTIITTPNASVAGTTIIISGTITAPNLNTGSGNSFTISSPVQAVVTLRPDLQASISGPTSLTAGIAGNYLINVSNTGNGASTGTSNTTVTLPAGLTYTSSVGTNWTCNPTALANGTTSVACAYSGAIATNTFANPLTIVATPASSIAGTTVNISGNVSTTNESNTSNNNFNQNVNIIALPSTSINLSASITGPSPLVAGNGGNFIITGSNTGNTAHNGQTVITTLIPSAMIYTGFTGQGWSCSSALQNGGTSVLCTSNQSIPAGGNANALTLQLTPMSILANGTVLTLTGSIAGGGSTSQFSQAFTIQNGGGQTGSPDLTAQISAPASVESGSVVAYQINTKNIGTATYNGQSTVSVTLPAAVSFNSASGDGWACSSAVQISGTTLVTCTSTAPIPAGATANPISILAKPLSFLSAGAVVKVTGAVSGIGDSNTDNNSFSNNLTIQKAGNGGGEVNNLPDLTASISGNATTQIGQSTNFQVLVNNIGTGIFTGLTTLTTTLPTGISLSNFVGTGWNVQSSTQANGTSVLTMTNPSAIAANSSQNPLTISLLATSSVATNTTLNIVGFVAPTGDSNTANNNFGTNITVNNGTIPTETSLGLTISGPTIVATNVPSVYSISVTNTGLSQLAGPTTFTTTLPTGVALGSTDGAGWNCSSQNVANNNTQVSCKYSGTIVAQGTAPILTLNVIPSAVLAGQSFSMTGEVQNTATKPSNPVTKNIAVSAGSGLAYADLSTTIQVMNKTPEQNSSVVLSISVQNKGPLEANRVQTQVTLPEGLPIDNALVSVGVFDRVSRKWEIGKLLPNQTATLTISTRAMVAGVNFVSNEIISSDQPDPNSTPNNQIETEDDFDRRCFSVPVMLCSGDAFQISIPSSYTNIAWYRNGVAITGTGINGNSLRISQEGSYTFTSVGLSCPKDGCCALIVQSPVAGIITLASKTVSSCGTYDLRNMPCTVNGTEARPSMTYYAKEIDARNAQNELSSPVVGQSGTYWIRYQPITGCFAVAAVMVTIDTAPATPSISGIVNNSCPATSVNLSNIQPRTATLVASNFEWHTSNSSASPLVANVASVTGGTYYLFEKSATGCYSASSNPVTISIVECCKTQVCIPFTMKKDL